MRLNTQGIVLRETNYKEADKILTVLTREYGKRTVKARGCRRRTSRLTAASQLLVWSDMTLYQRGDFLTLNEAEVLEQFWSVRQDIELLAAASYFAEVVEAAAQEGEEAGDLLSLLLNSLYALAAARHIVTGDPRKLFSFSLDPAGMDRLGAMTEAFLMTQQERGFRTLDYYKQLTRPSGE